MASRKFAAIRWSVALKRRNGMQDCKLSIIWNDEMRADSPGGKNKHDVLLKTLLELQRYKPNTPW